MIVKIFKGFAQLNIVCLSLLAYVSVLQTENGFVCNGLTSGLFHNILYKLYYKIFI